MKLNLVPVSLLILAPLASIYGAFEKITDFEDGNLSDWSITFTELNGSDNGSVEIVTDPNVNFANQALRIHAEQPTESIDFTRARLPIPAIAYGTSATLYLRAALPYIDEELGEPEAFENPDRPSTSQRPSNTDALWGISNTEEASKLSDYNVLLRYRHSTLDVYDGTVTGETGQMSSYQPVEDWVPNDVWVRYWIHIKNIAQGEQTFQIYYSIDGKDIVTAYPQIGGELTPFRNKPDGESTPLDAAIDNFVVSMTSGSEATPKGTDPMYFDDLYIDLNGLNLSDPRPAEILTAELNELNDTLSSSQTQASRLINISTRGYVDSNGKNLIGGFVIEGSENMTVLIQGVGTELESLENGVPTGGALPDGSLRLVTPEGDIINSDWDDNDATAMKSLMESTGSIKLVEGSGSSSITKDLAPGIYTVILDSENGSEGFALIEVYEIPEDL